MEVDDLYLEDQEELVLLMIRDSKTFQEMADTLNVSIRTCQVIVDDLIDLGLVERVLNENGKSVMGGKARKLTRKGAEYLKTHGHKTNLT